MTNNSTAEESSVDACPNCGDEVCAHPQDDPAWKEYRCGTVYGYYPSDLCHEREKSQKLEAEVVALAQAIHSRTDPYPEWAICDSVTGIISQINNMVGGVLDRAEKAESEVERLQSQLKRAIEIAEDIKKGGEMALQVIRESGRWAFEPHDDPRAEIKQGIEKLNAFKAEIK
jgi:hypothetical protein